MERFIVIDQFASLAPYPYHVLDNLTAERDTYTDFRDLAQQEADERNQQVREGTYDA